MRIIGGHDYYDTAMAFGQDAANVFVRPKAETMSDAEANALGLVFPKDNPFRVDVLDKAKPQRGTRAYSRYVVGAASFSNRGEEWAISSCTVLFCGRVHSGAFARGGKVDPRTGFACPSQRVFFWSWESLREWAAERGVQVLAAGSIWNAMRERRPVSAHFDPKQVSPAVLGRLIEKRITVATRMPPGLSLDSERPWRLNGDDLGAAQFWRVADAYTAFQEIGMWVGGVLPRPGNPMVEISDDKVKIHKAGFDVRSSFRNVA